MIDHEKIIVPESTSQDENELKQYFWSTRSYFEYIFNELIKEYVSSDFHNDDNYEIL